MAALPEPEMNRLDRLRRAVSAMVARFRGADETGETDYWNRGGLAGVLGMPPWHEQPPETIAEGFAGAITPKVGALLKGTKPIRAYHGSPHDFDKFDLSKIGTGEGAQAYGHGLYFAENEGVARNYRDKLSGAPPIAGGSQLLKKIPGIAYQQFFGKYRRKAPLGRMLLAGRNHEEFWQDAMAGRISPDELPPSIRDEFAAIQASSRPGRMYEVDIHADPERFLDWDKPLSGQPAADVLAPSVERAIKEEIVGGYHPNPLMATGEDAYGAAVSLEPWKPGGPRTDRMAVSERLKGAGIPGIKYLDQGSRTAGEGSRNYVLFDDQLISILRKYGLLGMIGGAAGSGAADAGSEQ